MSNYQEFKKLHHQEKILHIGNVWDVQSALIFEKMRYKSIGTSSAAIATSLGYEDGEEMSFDELVQVTKSILKRTTIPLTVDLEAGYSRDVEQIIKNIMCLSEIGVAGINLEDSIVENKIRKIMDSNKFSKILKTIKMKLNERDIEIFLNIRTDAYIMGLKKPLEESISRAKLYEAAGADCIFIPCVTNDVDIKTLVDNVSVPINVMAMPDLPDFSTLESLGVKRISVGPLVQRKLGNVFDNLLKSIENDQSFNTLFQ